MLTCVVRHTCTHVRVRPCPLMTPFSTHAGRQALGRWWGPEERVELTEGCCRRARLSHLGGCCLLLRQVMRGLHTWFTKKTHFTCEHAYCV